MPMHYVLVADAARARILSAGATLDDLDEVHTLDHPDSRLHTRDLVTDQAASSGVQSGSGRSAHTGPDAHEHEHERFGHELARLLNDARTHNAYERLILVAPPKFLGILRNKLDSQTAKTVVASIAHDFTHTETRDLPAAIRKHLPDDAGLP